MDAWIQWNRDGFVAGVAGAVTTAFDQRLVRVHARGAWLVSEKPGFNEELSRCEGYRVGTGGGWRNQAAANYLGPSRALPADCFSCGWIFGSARCGWERVATLWGLSSGSSRHLSQC